MIDIEQVNGLGHSDFVAMFGDIAEGGHEIQLGKRVRLRQCDG